MPPIFEVFEKHKYFVSDSVVIRLHGPDRKGIEEVTGKKWNEIVQPKNYDVDRLSRLLSEVKSKIFLFITNRFEGSAPRTISRITNMLTASE